MIDTFERKRRKVIEILQHISYCFSDNAIELIDSFIAENQVYFIDSFSALLTGEIEAFNWVVFSYESSNELAISCELMDLFDGYFCITKSVLGTDQLANWTISNISP